MFRKQTTADSSGSKILRAEPGLLPFTSTLPTLWDRTGTSAPEPQPKQGGHSRRALKLKFHPGGTIHREAQLRFGRRLLATFRSGIKASRDLASDSSVEPLFASWQCLCFSFRLCLNPCSLQTRTPSPPGRAPSLDPHRPPHVHTSALTLASRNPVTPCKGPKPYKSNTDKPRICSQRGRPPCFRRT